MKIPDIGIWLLILLVCGYLAWSFLFAPSPGLQEGDVVSPVWAGAAKWKAGQTVQLGTRLMANREGRAHRLNFYGIPRDNNPKATVTFFNQEEKLESQEVEMSHRC